MNSRRANLRRSPSTATVDPGAGGTTLTNTTAITGRENVDPYPDNDDGSVDVVVALVSDLGVTKAVSDATPLEGETIDFTIDVINNGPNDTTNAIVDDLLPAGLTFVSASTATGSYDSASGIWSIGALANTGTASLTISATVDAGTDATAIDNTATVSSDNVDLVPANDTDTAGIFVGISADLTVAKIVDEPVPAAGDTIKYTIVLTNLGPDPAADVVVDDLLPAGLTFDTSSTVTGSYDDSTGEWTVGTLGVTSATLEIEATVDPSAIGIITNTADASSTTTDPVLTNNTDSADISVSVADLWLTKVVDDPGAKNGDDVVFTIAVTNLGPETAFGVVVNDLVDPADFTVTGSTPEPGTTYSTATGVWDIGTLANGASATLLIDAEVAAANDETATNTATVSSDTSDPDPTNNSGTANVVVDGKATDVEVIKTVDIPAPFEGDTVVFTITVNNNGPENEEDLQISDLLPAGLTLVSVGPETDPGAPTTGDGTYTPGTGIWDIGKLDGGKSETLTLTATVDAGTAGTDIVNTAAITDRLLLDSNPDNDSDTATVSVPLVSDLGVTKVASDPVRLEGETVTFTIDVINNGPDDTINAEVDDLLPAGLTFVSASTATGIYDGASGVWAIGSIANGATVSLDIVATTDVGTDGTLIVNTSTVSSDVLDFVPANDSDTADVFVGLPADLEVIKTVDETYPALGSVVTYTVALTNLGPELAADVTVDDLLPAGVSFAAARPDIGNYDFTTGLWTVGSLSAGTTVNLELDAVVDFAADGTVVTNTATASSTTDDQDPTNNSDTADIDLTNAEVELTKVVDDPGQKNGDPVIFTIVVTNNGPDAAQNVVVNDLVDPADFTVTGSTPEPGTTYSAATGVWDIGTLANGASVTLLIDADVAAVER